MVIAFVKGEKSKGETRYNLDEIGDLEKILKRDIPRSEWNKKDVVLKTIKKNFLKYFIDKFFQIWTEKLEDPFNLGDHHGSSDEAYHFVEYLQKKNGIRHPLDWWLTATEKQIVSELKNNRTSYYDKVKHISDDRFTPENDYFYFLKSK